MINEGTAPEKGNYGKFDTAEELLKAYNALEAEFTKRCQLIGKLQAELDSVKNAQAETSAARSDDDLGDVEARSEHIEEAPSAERQASADSARRRDALCFDAVTDEIAKHAREYAEFLSAIPEIMNACVALYKQRRLSGAVHASPAGAAVLTPVKRPKTLLEAKLLADTMLG